MSKTELHLARLRTDPSPTHYVPRGHFRDETPRMRYLALCTDYDGTIANRGSVDEPTIDALERLKESGGSW